MTVEIASAAPNAAGVLTRDAARRYNWECEQDKLRGQWAGERRLVERCRPT